MDANAKIDKYLEQSGQTFQELMGGLCFFGMPKIESLVDQALQENKKIIWIDLDPEKGIGRMDYKLEN